MPTSVLIIISTLGVIALEFESGWLDGLKFEIWLIITARSPESGILSWNSGRQKQKILKELPSYWEHRSQQMNGEQLANDVA